MQASQSQRLKLEAATILRCNPNFSAAVSSGNADQAATVAVHVIHDLLAATLAQTHAAAKSQVDDKFAYAHLFQINDTVFLKAHSGPDNRKAGPAGYIRAQSGQTKCKVEWENGKVSEHAYDELVFGGRESGRIARKASRPELLSALVASLLAVEVKVAWSGVADSFKARRSQWCAEVKEVTCLQEWVALYAEFVKICRINQDMPNVALKCNTPDLLEKLESLGNDNVEAAHKVWRTTIEPELELWTSQHQKVSTAMRVQQLRAGRAAQLLEREGAAHASKRGITYYSPMVLQTIMDNGTRQLLLDSLKRERESLHNKKQQLSSHMAAGHTGLTPELMSGVTYGRDGLGGSYGGAPRARAQMLDGILDFRSDCATEEDDGSDATDLADSWLMADGEDLSTSVEVDGRKRARPASREVTRHVEGGRDQVPMEQE